MSDAALGEGRFIWATRGLNWGYTFLKDGGYPDPLQPYEEAFSLISDQVEGWCRVGGAVAVRFRDPAGRKDTAGREIRHDFVLLGSLGDGIDSVDAGRRRIWPSVKAEFEACWDQSGPP